MPTKSKAKRLPSTKKQEASPPPKWPVLKPLVPPSDLCLDTLLEGHIVLIRNFFTSSLCKTYVAFLSSLQLVTTPGQPRKGDAVRVNDRFQVDDPAFAEQLWNTTGLRDLLTRDKTDSEGPKQEVTRLWGGEFLYGLLSPDHYDARFYHLIRHPLANEAVFVGINMEMVPHDESNVLSLPTSPPTAAKTTWTLLVYLTGPSTGCVGGETVFYPELGPAKKFSGKETDGTHPVVVNLEVGMALLHKHGQDCLLHEGREVAQGEKWVIRSDLCVKR
ncbi:MAG: hypothetical protein L6R39_002682 [Caloplaca ligustica]|nr:MAG: hypothetical protein L6R39_002682 [Caloplaca ligustica]